MFLFNQNKITIIQVIQSGYKNGKSEIKKGGGGEMAANLYIAETYTVYATNTTKIAKTLNYKWTMRPKH